MAFWDKYSVFGAKSVVFAANTVFLNQIQCYLWPTQWYLGANPVVFEAITGVFGGKYRGTLDKHSGIWG